jgi:hypothetical protein
MWVAPTFFWGGCAGQQSWLGFPARMWEQGPFFLGWDGHGCLLGVFSLFFSVASQTGSCTITPARTLAPGREFPWHLPGPPRHRQERSEKGQLGSDKKLENPFLRVCVSQGQETAQSSETGTQPIRAVGCAHASHLWRNRLAVTGGLLGLALPPASMGWVSWYVIGACASSLLLRWPGMCPWVSSSSSVIGFCAFGCALMSVIGLCDVPTAQTPAPFLLLRRHYCMSYRCRPPLGSSQPAPLKRHAPALSLFHHLPCDQAGTPWDVSAFLMLVSVLVVCIRALLVAAICAGVCQPPTRLEL